MFSQNDQNLDLLPPSPLVCTFLVLVTPVHYGLWNHSGQWKHFIKTIRGAFRNRTINLLMHCGRTSLYAIIGCFQLLIQNKLFPSFSCHFFYNALQNSLFTVKYEIALKISEKHTKDCYFCQLCFTESNFLYSFPARCSQIFNSSTSPI